MIEIIARDGPHEAISCPALICDACRKQVAREATILYWSRYVGDRRQCSPLFVAHKECCRALERYLYRSYPHEDGWQCLWEEGRIFLRHLANNFVHRFEDDRHGVFHDHDVIFAGQEVYEPERPKGTA